MKNYYVYIYINPLKDNEPFYVGKGKLYRKNSHLNETNSNTHNPHKYHTIQKIKRATSNDPPIKIFRSNLTNEEAIQIERGLIWAFGRADLSQGPLTNLTDGGEGPEGILVSEATKRKISLGCKGKNRGRPQSEEIRLKISNSCKNRKLSEEHKKKLRKPKSQTLKMRGRVVSLETKNKISEANKAAWSIRKINNQKG